MRNRPILVIDYDSMLCKLIISALTDAGFEVLIALRGPKGTDLDMSGTPGARCAPRPRFRSDDMSKELFTISALLCQLTDREQSCTGLVVLKVMLSGEQHGR